jgi:hypothetical protein
VGRTNPAEGAIDKVVKEYRQLKRAADKSNTVPLGKERLSSREAASRFEEMSPGQREGLIKEMGIDEAMKLVRRIKA